MQNISYSLILAALVNATGGMGPITYGSTNQDRFSIPCGQSHSTMALGTRLMRYPDVLFAYFRSVVFHVLYFTIVEAMFSLDGNSYITKWPIVMYLKNTGRNSTFRGKFFRREVSLLTPTPRRRAFARISLVFSTHFHFYQPSFAIIDSINQCLF